MNATGILQVVLYVVVLVALAQPDPKESGGGAARRHVR